MAVKHGGNLTLSYGFEFGLFYTSTDQAQEISPFCGHWKVEICQKLTLTKLLRT